MTERCSYGTIGALVFASLLIPVSGSAQQAGAIAGIVRDTSGAVLPGVTVEARSPALIEQLRVVSTDGSGQYRIVDLRPGTYEVTFTLPGFTAVRRQGIELTAGFTANVTVELRVGGVDESITVSGASPVVDVQNVTQVRNLTREVLDTIPSGKQITSLANLIPGVVSAGASGASNMDVGGSTGMSFAVLSIHGGRQGDQTVTVNGMSVASMSFFDNSRTNLQDGNIEELSIQTAASQAEFASGGVSLNVVPKDGGNTFRGGLFLSGTQESWQSNNVDSDLQQKGLRSVNRVKQVVDVNPSFGGPLAKDRLWFFAAYRYVTTESYVGGLYYNKTPSAWVYTPDLDRRAINGQWGSNASGNFTWQASKRNKLTLFYNYEFQCNCHFGISPNISPEASRNMRPRTRLYQGTWTNPLTNRLLLEAGLSFYPVAFPRDPQPDATEPSILEQSTGLRFRSASTYVRNDQQLDTYRASLSYITGQHALKFGIYYIRGYQPDKIWTIGDFEYRTLNGVPNQVTYWTTPYTNDLAMQPLSLFVQDQWTLNRWTVNAGLRFDRLLAFYNDVYVPPTQFLPVPREFPGADVVDWKDLNPRLGVSRDLFGNGKTAVKATLNRYVVQEGRIPLMDVHPTVAATNNIARTWTDANRDFTVQGDPLNPASNGELGPSPNVNFGQPTLTYRHDQDFANGWGTRTHNWEASLSVQHELVPRVSVTAAYFRRIYGNFKVIDNMRVSPSDYDPYCIPAPADSRLPGGGGFQICDLYDLNPSKVGLVDNVRTTSEKYGKQMEHWDGGDLTVNARLGGGVLLQGGFSGGKTMTDNCDVVTKVDNPSQRFCHQESKFLTQMKFVGSYTLPAKIQMSATYQTLVPDPEAAFTYNSMGMHANYVATNQVIRPSLGRNLAAGANATASVNLIDPGSLYGDRMHQLDLRLAKEFATRGVRFKAIADFYNMLNSNTITRFNPSYGTSGASWLVPQEVLPGRLFRLGVQVNF